MGVFKYLFVSLFVINNLITPGVGNNNQTSWISISGLKEVIYRTTNNIYVNITCEHLDHSVLNLSIEDEDIATIISPRTFIICDNASSQYTVVLEGKFLGRTNLIVNVNNKLVEYSEQSNELNSSDLYSDVYNVTVVKHDTPLNTAFIAVIATLIIILNFGFGCQIEIDVIKSILKKPIAPIIGASCQFIVMPLLGCGLAYLLQMESYLGFGLFVTAAAPGGGASNVWTFLLGADLDLSITMTFFSKCIALGAMPLWVFALGRLFSTDGRIIIPYTNIVTGIVSILIPCLLGILLGKYKPVLAKRLHRFVKPVAAVFIVWVIVVGSITQPYVYVLMGRLWYVIPSGILLPYVGMTIGYVIAKVTRQSHIKAVTIAIETGLQDTGIAIILLLTSFQSPDGDLAATMPITCAIFTPLPLAVALIVKTIYKKCWLMGKCTKCGGPQLEVDHSEQGPEEEKIPLDKENPVKVDDVIMDDVIVDDVTNNDKIKENGIHC